VGIQFFDHVTLTLMFDVSNENLNPSYILEWCTIALVFHMSVACDKTFL
jgi:hypothetical protein